MSLDKIPFIESEATILRKDPNMLTRIIDGETVLVPIRKTPDETSYVYPLSEPASIIWQMIDGKRTLGEIKKMVLKEFEASPQEVDREIQRFLKGLKEIKAIK